MNMQIVQRTSDTAIANTYFTTSLFDSFISFVGRGESTTRTYYNNLRYFSAWMKYSNIQQPQRQDIIDYKDFLASEHQAIEWANNEKGWAFRLDNHGNYITIACKPATIRLRMQSVKQFFKWTSVNNLYPNIAEQIHTPKVRMDIHKRDALGVADVLTIEQSIEAKAQEKMALQATYEEDTQGRIQRSKEQGKRLYAMYLLAVNAGLRTVEISRANIKDLECVKGQAYLYVWGKGHTEADQKKPIAKEVYQAIQDYLASRTDKPTPNSPLFVGTGNKAFGRRLEAGAISRLLKKAMVEAGFNSERLTAHSLRHTAGTVVQEITGDLYTTQKYMRHTDPKTTEIYLHNETERKEANVAQKLYATYHGQGQGPMNGEDLTEGLTPSQVEMLKTFANSLRKS